MATFFKTFAEFKEQASGAVNQGLDLNSLAATIDNAADSHIKVWIGEDFWEELLAAYNGTPSTEQTALIKVLQRALVHLTLLEYTSIGSVQLSDMGLIRMENENAKTAYKYQTNEYKDYMRTHGFEALEKLIKYLYKKKDDFPTWRNSEEFKKSRSLFLNYASEFRSSYSKYIDRYTFETLRSLIEDIEEFAIRPLLGETLYIEIKEKIITESLQKEQAKLIPVLQKAIAHFTIEEALKKNWINIIGNRVIQVERLEPQSSERQGTPGAKAMSVSIYYHEQWANRHISKVKTYLEKHATELCWTDPTPTEEIKTEEERNYPNNPCVSSSSSGAIVNL